MASKDDAPEPYYIAYIDEAGDPDLKRVKPLDPDGGSEWMVLGAVLVRASVEPETVQWVRDIRYKLKAMQGPELHFRRLTDPRKRIVCEHVSSLRLRGFAVVSHKPNMRQWKNPAAEAYLGPRGWFYNWCIRLLLERVTDACERSAIRHYGEPRPLKLVFSERGGVKYRWLRAYIEVLMNQARDGRTFLEKRVIKHRVLRTGLIDVVQARHSAGCQLADVITSAFYSAAHARGPRWYTEPAKILKPCMATEKGMHHDYGVALQPTPDWRAARGLTFRQKEIFEFYGYDLR